MFYNGDCVDVDECMKDRIDCGPNAQDGLISVRNLKDTFWETSKSVSTNQAISHVNAMKDSIISTDFVKDLIRIALYGHVMHMVHLIWTSMVIS